MQGLLPALGTCLSHCDSARARPVIRHPMSLGRPRPKLIRVEIGDSVHLLWAARSNNAPDSTYFELETTLSTPTINHCTVLLSELHSPSLCFN